MTDRARWLVVLVVAALALLAGGGSVRYRLHHPELTETQLWQSAGFWLPWRSGE